MWWAIALTLVVVGLAWYPCCCTSTGGCSKCSGATPDGFNVAVTGVADDNCTGCAAAWNGTWLCDYVVGACLRSYTETGSISVPVWDGSTCTTDTVGQVQASLGVIGDDRYIANLTGSGLADWYDTLTTPIDCCSFSKVMTLQSFSPPVGFGACDFSSAAATMSNGTC